MYLIVSGTNRAESNTIKVAQHYQKILSYQGIRSEILSLQGLNLMERNPFFEDIEKRLLVPASKFIFIAPEYNGSIPGVLKCLFDISDSRKVWPGKKALLTGVATGRAGNVRGLDHLTGILNYLGVIVHPNKLPISVVDRLINASEVIDDLATLKAIEAQLGEFVLF